MRAAFRKLGTLTLMAWGFLFFSPSVLASGPVYLPSNGGYYSDAQAACDAAWEYAKLNVQGDPTLVAAHADQTSCTFTYTTWRGTAYGQGLSCASDVPYCRIQREPSCPSDESKDLFFSGSVFSSGGTNYAVTDAPSSYCINGCNYNRISNASSCSIDGDKSTCSYEFVSDATTCTSVPDPESDSPDPTQEPDGYMPGATTGTPSTGDTGGNTGSTGGDTGDMGGCASTLGCGDTSGSGPVGGGDTGDTGGTGGDTGGTGGDTGGTGGDTGGTGGDTSGTGTGTGDTGGSTGTGTTGAATSADIRNLGDRLTTAITGHYNSLASSISGLGDRLTGKLDQLGEKVDALNGPAFSEGDVPGEDGGTVSGSESGTALAGQIGAAVDQAVADREAALRDDLGTIDGMVSGWFGPNGTNIDSNDLLGSMFPAPAGCRDYTLPVYQDIVLTLPVCRLAAIKPLLEWVFAVLTAIGVWRILMNGLIGSAGRETSGRR